MNSFLRLGYRRPAQDSLRLWSSPGRALSGFYLLIAIQICGGELPFEVQSIHRGVNPWRLPDCQTTLLYGSSQGLVSMRGLLEAYHLASNSSRMEVA